MPNEQERSAMLNAAGEALKQLGETGGVLLGYWPADHLRIEECYTIRLEAPGAAGAHGSGSSPTEAYRNALRQREEDAERARIRAEIEAETERRMNQRRAA